MTFLFIRVYTCIGIHFKTQKIFVTSPLLAFALTRYVKFDQGPYHSNSTHLDYYHRLPNLDFKVITWL